MSIKIEYLAGMLKEARCRAMKDEFSSADAVINFFEEKLINLCMEEFDKFFPSICGFEFDITKFQEESRPVEWMNRQRQTQRQANKNKIGIDEFRNRNQENQENQDTEVT